MILESPSLFDDENLDLDIHAFCDLEQLKFIDIESSGLARGAFPIEYASCGLDLSCSSFLIKPSSDFDPLANWSLEAEKLHGIKLQDLIVGGVDSYVAATRIRKDFEGAVIVLSDNADHDLRWLAKLDPELSDLPILPVNLFLKRLQTDALQRHGLDVLSNAVRRCMEVYPHVHRAVPDCVRLAALFRVLVDDKFMLSI